MTGAAISRLSPVIFLTGASCSSNNRPYPYHPNMANICSTSCLLEIIHTFKSNT